MEKQIEAAIRALHNVDNLPMPRVQSAPTIHDNIDMREERIIKSDILDWLSSVFGFQVSFILTFLFLVQFVISFAFFG